MSDFEPFDEEYKFDKNILTDGFPAYMYPSVVAWMRDVMTARKLLFVTGGKPYLSSDKLVLPMSRILRIPLSTTYPEFIAEIRADIKIFRNALTYILQNHTFKSEAEALEKILSDTSSAYAVHITTSDAEGVLAYKKSTSKLIYRVPQIVKRQAEEAISNEHLLVQAWESHYGVEPNDEITVTRVTDALAGILRDKFFPQEKRSQLGTLINKIKKEPIKYQLPSSSIYDQDKLLDIMRDFSKIRGNHKTGTGRAPTHEEAGFVLHYAIFLFQILR